jgi:hypothetical protein
MTQSVRGSTQLFRSAKCLSSEAMAKYVAEIHAAAPNVVAVALEPR